MYDHFVGEVIATSGALAVLRCGGIGYELKVPIGTAARLEVGAEATLFSILHVVDGAPTLLGFGSRAERELARRVLAVSGIGPAIALAALSSYDPHTLGGLIVAQDVAALKRIKGIGTKTAERLCLELRDRIALLDLDEPGSRPSPQMAMTPAAADAVTALVTLGYSEKDAEQRIAKALEREPGADTEAMIKAVLRG